MNYQLIQQSLAEKSNVDIYRDFKKMVERYQLIVEGDVIAVEISQDKNSLLLLSCLNEFYRESNKSFELKYFLAKDSDIVSKEIQEIIETFNIKEYIILEQENAEDAYVKMQEQGCTKAALPNNYNDIVNSTFMTFMQRKQTAQIHPKRSSNYAKQLQFIRPLCIVEDGSIIKWVKGVGLDIVEGLTLFSRLAFVEEDVVYAQQNQNIKYEFAIYERV